MRIFGVGVWRLVGFFRRGSGVSAARFFDVGIGADALRDMEVLGGPALFRNIFKTL